MASRDVASVAEVLVSLQLSEQPGRIVTDEHSADGIEVRQLVELGRRPLEEVVDHHGVGVHHQHGVQRPKRGQQPGEQLVEPARLAMMIVDRRVHLGPLARATSAVASVQLSAITHTAAGGTV